ncbi:MAG TPA: YqgE/AlgH family protein [Candidatus Binatia bacterium]|nr:YqgE/AlgH family protein [Candidatus Binatia bacterium]
MTAPACCLLAILAAGAVAPDARPRPEKGKLLVATRQLGDPSFGESVVLLLARDDSGVMGVIVNQPTTIKLAAVLPHVAPLAHRGDVIWRGGPVLPTSLLALVRAKQAPPDSDTVFGDVRILTSRDAFERALDGHVPRERLRAFAGYAGWTLDQLDDEIARGDWFVVPATADVVFSAAPEGLWRRLVERSEGQWTSIRGLTAPRRCDAGRAPAGAARASGRPW